jgi:hypothetical protein
MFEVLVVVGGCFSKIEDGRKFYKGLSFFGAAGCCKSEDLARGPERI